MLVLIMLLFSVKTSKWYLYKFCELILNHPYHPDTDLASEEKKRLEEKQRAARKKRSQTNEEWKTK